MEWYQVLTIVGSIGAFMWYFLTRLEKDISRLERRIEGIIARNDKHEQRIDMLYQMFVDLLKEQKK